MRKNLIVLLLISVFLTSLCTTSLASDALFTPVLLDSTSRYEWLLSDAESRGLGAALAITECVFAGIYDSLNIDINRAVYIGHYDDSDINLDVLFTSSDGGTVDLIFWTDECYLFTYSSSPSAMIDAYPSSYPHFYKVSSSALEKGMEEVLELMNKYK